MFNIEHYGYDVVKPITEMGLDKISRLSATKGIENMYTEELSNSRTNERTNNNLNDASF